MRRVWFALIVASFGWGTAGVATRSTLTEGVEPYALATLRSLLAAVLVIGFLVVQRRGIPRAPEAWKVGLMMGVTNLAIPFILSNIALQYASAGFLGLTTALIPLITAVVAHFTLADEPMTIFKTAGLVIGFGGVAFLLASGDSGLAEGGRPLLAGLLALIAVTSISVGGVYAKHHSGRYKPLDVTGVHFLTGTLVITVATFSVEGGLGTVTPRAWALLAYMGVVSTFLPFILYYWMLRTVSATFAAIAGYIVPVIAVVAGIVFLDEVLQPGIVIGGLLILIGVVITDRSERQVRQAAVLPR